MWLRIGSGVGLLYGRKCTIGFRKTHNFSLTSWGTTSAWRRNAPHRHNSYCKKKTLHIWCTCSEGRDIRTYIQCRLCGSRALKVIRELRDCCWRSFVFYTFVIAKNVVSLCLLQPQGFLKAFVMETWRHLCQLDIFLSSSSILKLCLFLFSFHFMSDLC